MATAKAAKPRKAARAVYPPGTYRALAALLRPELLAPAAPPRQLFLPNLGKDTPAAAP